MAKLECAAVVFLSCVGIVVFRSLTFLTEYQYWKSHKYYYSTNGNFTLEYNNLNTTSTVYTNTIIVNKLITITRYIGWLLGIAAFLMVLFVVCFVHRISGTKRLHSLKRVTIFVLLLCALCGCLDVYLYTENRGLLWTYFSVIFTVFTIPLVYSYGLSQKYNNKDHDDDVEKLI